MLALGFSVCFWLSAFLPMGEAQSGPGFSRVPSVAESRNVIAVHEVFVMNAAHKVDECLPMADLIEFKFVKLLVQPCCTGENFGAGWNHLGKFAYRTKAQQTSDGNGRWLLRRGKHEQFGTGFVKRDRFSVVNHVESDRLSIQWSVIYIELIQFNEYPSPFFVHNEFDVLFSGLRADFGGVSTLLCRFDRATKDARLLLHQISLTPNRQQRPTHYDALTPHLNGLAFHKNKGAEGGGDTEDSDASEANIGPICEPVKFSLIGKRDPYGFVLTATFFIAGIGLEVLAVPLLWNGCARRLGWATAVLSLCCWVGGGITTYTSQKAEERDRRNRYSFRHDSEKCIRKILNAVQLL
jgi:hypothetical protein